MRETMETILANEQLLVYTAVDGKDAIAKTLALRPDLILLDLHMPNLNGVTFLKAIRAGTETHDTPIIVVTGLTAEGRLEECMAAGADDFMTKPFQMEDLLLRVRAMLAAAGIGDHVERVQQYILAVRQMRQQAQK